MYIWYAENCEMFEKLLAEIACFGLLIEQCNLH